MNKNLDIVAVGYPSIDHILSLETTPQLGETSIILNDNNQNSYFGGCAVNITCLLSIFDYQCGLAMIVGNDFESSGFGDFLRDKNISLDFILENSTMRTSYTTLLMNPEGDHMTLFYPGPMNEKKHTSYNLSNMKANYGLITIGDLAGNKQFLNECIKKEIPIIFSMKGDFSSVKKCYLIKVFEHSELIFMNKMEKEVLDKYLPMPVLSYLERPSLKAVIVTDGSNGSNIYAKSGKIIFIPVVKNVIVKDTTGGGDAYIAGFLNEYLRGNRNLEECGISGAVLSSFIIEDYGCLTNIPDQKSFKQRKINLSKEKWYLE